MAEADAPPSGDPGWTIATTLCLPQPNTRRTAVRELGARREAMASSHALGELAACLSQEDAAIGLSCYQAFPLETGDALDRSRMRDSQTLGDIGRTRLPVDRQKIGDELDIVLQQGGRSRRASF